MAATSKKRADGVFGLSPPAPQPAVLGHRGALPPKDIDPFIESGEIKITGAAFLDHFGHLAVYEEGYPFTYERGDAYYIYDKADGLDFALIRLDDLQEKAFLHNGLVFISRVNWEHQHKLEFDSYLMLGIRRVKIIQETARQN